MRDLPNSEIKYSYIHLVGIFIITIINIVFDSSQFIVGSNLILCSYVFEKLSNIIDFV